MGIKVGQQFGIGEMKRTGTQIRKAIINARDRQDRGAGVICALQESMQAQQCSSGTRGGDGAPVMPGHSRSVVATAIETLASHWLMLC